MIFAAIVVLILAVLLSYALWPYINAFIGAVILYVLFKPLYKYLHTKQNLSKSFSAILVIIITIFLVVIPFIILLTLVTGEAIDLFQNKEALTGFVESIDAVFPNLDFQNLLSSQITNVTDFMTNLLLDLLKSLGNFLVILLIMYFTLYYLLIYRDEILNALEPFIPFNDENTKKLIRKAKNITNTTIVSTGIIALVQGILLTIAFLIFGIKGAFLWGFVTTILSFLPVVGSPIVWVPVVIFNFANGNYFVMTGILIFGIFISTVDNFIRPYLQKRMGNIHPLTTLVGIFIGVPVFGLLGIIAGPILISYFIQTVKMFREEYVE